jgi:hypothetical protein
MLNDFEESKMQPPPQPPPQLCPGGALPRPRMPNHLVGGLKWVATNRFLSIDLCDLLFVLLLSGQLLACCSGALDRLSQVSWL